MLTRGWGQRAEQHSVYLPVPQRPFDWLIHQGLFQQRKMLNGKTLTILAFHPVFALSQPAVSVPL